MLELVLETKHMPQSLAQHGTVNVTAEEVAQRIGQVFIQRVRRGRCFDLSIAWVFSAAVLPLCILAQPCLTAVPFSAPGTNPSSTHGFLTQTV